MTAIGDQDELHALQADPDVGPSDEDWATHEALSALAVALPQPPLPNDLRARLMASATKPAGRFAPFADRLARMIDVTVERAAQLLESISDPASWVPAPKLGPGVALIHLDGGAVVAGADVGFVRVPAGVRFPPHVHHGDEHVLILQGRQQEEDGTIVEAGERVFMAGGSAHAFNALPGDELIYAVVVFGVEFPGIPDALDP